MSPAKEPDAENAAAQPKAKAATQPPAQLVPVSGLISEISGEVIITQEIVLQRLQITELPAAVGLTNLDFLKDAEEDAEDD